MKTNKSKVQKKDTKKAVKKELEKSLISKFLEAVKHLGHDAEKVTKDIEIAGKFIAKKIAKKIKGTKSAVESDLKEKVGKKPVVQPKPLAQSVKVAAIATEEKAAEAISKPLKTLVKEIKTTVAKAEEAMKPSVKPIAPVARTAARPATKVASKPATKSLTKSAPETATKPVAKAASGKTTKTATARKKKPSTK